MGRGTMSLRRSTDRLVWTSFSPGSKTIGMSGCVLSIDDDDDDDDERRKDSNQNNHIKVVCIPQAHWSDGSYVDLKIIGEECKKRDIIFVQKRL